MRHAICQALEAHIPTEWGNGTITGVQPWGAFAELDEWPGIEGGAPCEPRTEFRRPGHLRRHARQVAGRPARAGTVHWTRYLERASRRRDPETAIDAQERARRQSPSQASHAMKGRCTAGRTGAPPAGASRRPAPGRSRGPHSIPPPPACAPQRPTGSILGSPLRLSVGAPYPSASSIEHEARVPAPTHSTSPGNRRRIRGGRAKPTPESAASRAEPTLRRIPAREDEPCVTGLRVRARAPTWAPRARG